MDRLAAKVPLLAFVGSALTMPPLNARSLAPGTMLPRTETLSSKFKSMALAGSPKSKKMAEFSPRAGTLPTPTSVAISPRVQLFVMEVGMTVKSVRM